LYICPLPTLLLEFGLKNWLFYHRYGKKINKYWNDRLLFIQEQARLQFDGGDVSSYTQWGQYVSQEMLMWCKIGEIISKEEFINLCNRRGFNNVQVDFLREFLYQVGLKGGW
jgi:hypothetical protein